MGLSLKNLTTKGHSNPRESCVLCLQSWKELQGHETREVFKDLNSKRTQEKRHLLLRCCCKMKRTEETKLRSKGEPGLIPGNITGM